MQICRDLYHQHRGDPTDEICQGEPLSGCTIKGNVTVKNAVTWQLYGKLQGYLLD